MKYFKKIESERLYFSPMNVEDAELYTIWLNDLYTSLAMGFAENITGLDKEREILKELDKTQKSFAIVLKDGDRLIGNCGLFDINYIHRTGTVGIFIGSEEDRGYGYGTEALTLLVAFGFKILNLHNISLTVQGFNERGIKSYKKIGFKTTGKKREGFELNGKRYDIVYMDILRWEFRSKLLDRALNL